jgi:hypothetical protein
MLPDPRTGDTSCLQENAFERGRDTGPTSGPDHVRRANPQTLTKELSRGSRYFPLPPRRNMREASAVSPILDDFGGDERTRTADPLLAKHALGNALTCGFARRGGRD